MAMATPQNPNRRRNGNGRRDRAPHDALSLPGVNAGVSREKIDDRELRVDVTREELRDAPKFERRD